MTIKNYREKLLDHLEQYKINELGVTEQGIYDQKPHGHILPEDKKDLNLIEGFREAIKQAGAEPNRKWNRHKGFAHLNSSQAFSWNLFFPLLHRKEETGPTLIKALGFPADQIDDWDFEKVLDTTEGTNLDVWLSLRSGLTLGIEVKLTESDFGSTTENEQRKQKLESGYSQKLKGKVKDEILKDRKSFFHHYQILRNISYADANGNHAIFFYPAAYGTLDKKIKDFLDTYLLGSMREFVHIVYFEDFLKSVLADADLPGDIRNAMEEVKKKYVLEPGA